MKKPNKLLLLSCISLVQIGCSNKDNDLTITSADIVSKDDMSQLKVCFNRPLEKEERYISDTKVKTKDDFIFGRSDMYIGAGSNNVDGNCVYEPPYFFMRNSRNEEQWDNFKKSMKPNNIDSINIKLGSIQVNLSYSDEYKLTEYYKKY